MTSQSPQRPVDTTIAVADSHEVDARLDIELPWLQNLKIVCALTAGTLLLTGLVGKARKQTDNLDRRKRSHSSLGHRNVTTKSAMDLMTLDSAQRIAGRLLAVGSPFLAACFIGGERVAVMVLVAAAGDIATIEGSAIPPKLRNLKNVLKKRKWVLAVSLLQIITDVSGVTRGLDSVWGIVLGYTALVASVFILPLPFPNSTLRAHGVTSPLPKSSGKTSAIPSPWETTQAAARTSGGPSPICPLISSSKDIDLTLLAGALMGFVLLSNLILYPALPFFSFAQSGLGLVVSCIASLSLTISDPASLMTTRRFGLALGIFLPLIVQEIFFIQPWSVFACQGVVGGLFWTAINFDTQFNPSAAFSASPLVHQHGVGTHLGPHSGVTGLLLSATRDWPLLHSILMEKDSRRIFYFMR